MKTHDKDELEDKVSFQIRGKTEPFGVLLVGMRFAELGTKFDLSLAVP
jgi:hypothetical protein